MKPIKIGHKQISDSSPPFIIAELSGNHQGSLEQALELVDAAAYAGADAIKLQTYTADTMTLDIDHKDFFIDDPENIWAGQSLYQLYTKAATPWEWHQTIFKRAQQHGLLAFSTPFDETAVDFLESLQVPAYKIASFENNHLPLIRKVAATGKPIILSTGMAPLAELDEAVTVARQAGCQDLVLLKCTSAYPAPISEANLLTLPHLQDLFKCPVGLSDHTLGISVPLVSIALGARVIEKHFMLSTTSDAVDAKFSMDPEGLKSLVTETYNAWQSLGEVCYGACVHEQDSLKYRRSLYISQDMQKGEFLTHENLRVIRPGFGLAPKYFELVLECEINKDVPKGTPLSWDLICRKGT